MGLYQVRLLLVRVDKGAIAMKGYSTPARPSKQKPHNQVHFSIILKSPLFLCKGLTPL